MIPAQALSLSFEPAGQLSMLQFAPLSLSFGAGMSFEAMELDQSVPETSATPGSPSLTSSNDEDDAARH